MIINVLTFKKNDAVALIFCTIYLDIYIYIFAPCNIIFFMKNIFECLSLFFAIFLVSVSCTENLTDDASESDKQTPDIVFPDAENLRPVLSQVGGTVSISFTAKTDWVASTVNNRSESWLTVSPSSGTKGENKIILTASVNESYDERNATIVLKCGDDSKSIVLTQKQKNALTVTSSKFEVDDEGGDIVVEVNANVEFEVITKADWIQQKSVANSRAVTNSNLYFTVKPNETGSAREGEIIIKSGDLSERVVVYQAFRFIVLTRNGFTLPEQGGIIDVEIKSTVVYESKMLSDADWISEIQSRAESTHSHHYAVSPNESYDSREAKIVFYDPQDIHLADTVTVFQMYKGAIIVARDEYEFDTDGGILDLTLQTNLDIAVGISDSWIQQIQPTRGLEELSISFSIAKNTDRVDREGFITIKDKNGDRQQVITVRQSFVDVEREALVAFYESTGGDSWKNKTNWCSDLPISEWYGVSTDENGSVRGLFLHSNNLSGNIPDIFESLPNIRTLQLANNNLSGELPQSIYKATDLFDIYLLNNQLEGPLSEDIGNWQDIKTIEITRNNFSGVLPSALGKLPKLKYCGVKLNRFSGELSPEILNMEIRAEKEEEYKFWLEPQQAGYSFSSPATKKMIDLGDNIYLHPDGFALEYRQGVNQAIKWDKVDILAQKVYEKFEDGFDFVVLLYNVGNMEEIAGEIAGQFAPYSNSVQGIGQDIFDDTADLGSHGRVKGCIQLSDRRQVKGAFLHEIMHYWGGMDFGQQCVDIDGNIDKDTGGHWGISSINGLLGGFDVNTLERNVDGISNKYKAYCSLTDWCFGTVNSSSYAYSPFELYLMGFISPEEVPDIHYFTGVTGSKSEAPSKNGIFYAEEEHVLTIEDIIARFGPRIPDWNNSQKDFNVLLIVVTKDAVNDREWDLIESDVMGMQNQGSSGFLYGNMNFYEATGGRGTLTFGGLEKYRK